MELNERIAKARKDANFTQSALADAVGVTKGAVSQWEKGLSQPRTNKLEEIAKVTGVPVDWFIEGVIQDQFPNHQPNATILGPVDFPKGKTIPVYGQAVGGVNGEFEFNGNVLFDVLCPPQLSHIAGAYAIQVSGESMWPRYRDGEIVYVDPTRRVKKGDFVVAQIVVDEHSENPQAFIKMFCRHNAEELVLEQFNPAGELTFPHARVKSVHYIALSGDGL